MATRARRGSLRPHLFVLGALLGSLFFFPSRTVGQTVSGPSAFCHETDGAFTTCPDGSSEWSDITPAVFLETGGVVLVGQADLVDNSTVQSVCVGGVNDGLACTDDAGCPERAGGVPGVDTVPRLQESTLFDGIKPLPPIKKPQHLGSWFGIGRERDLFSEATKVLKAKFFDALGSRADNCEVSMWAAASNGAKGRALRKAFAEVANLFASAGLHAGFAPFTFAGKVLVVESLTLSATLVNDTQLGVLDPREIPEESARALLRATIGYMAPLLTRDYFEGKLAELAVRGSSELSGELLMQLLQHEELNAFSAVGQNIGPRGFPIVRARVGLVYSPRTHFVTLFVRAGGDGCLPDTLFVLRYEVDKHGLAIQDGVVPHVTIPLR